MSPLPVERRPALRAEPQVHSSLARSGSATVAALLAVQSCLGLWFQEVYRDADWIRATWFGNDWVTLVVAVPLFAIALGLARQGSVRGTLVWYGLLGYAVYNEAFYLFGAALNHFFPLYVVLLVVSVLTLVAALGEANARAMAAAVTSTGRQRAAGACFVLVGTGLALIWIGMWAAYVFRGARLPLDEPEAFKLIAALDLTVMVPALTLGGALLWRRHPWGAIVGGIAGVQGSLYLLVLLVNSLVAEQRGLAQGSGELMIWGPLFVVMASATAALLGSVRGRRAPALG